MDNKKLKNWWIISHYSLKVGRFQLSSPWWLKAGMICAAVQAPDEFSAREMIRTSYEFRPPHIIVTLCEERSDNWSPFCEEYPKDNWMEWPPSVGEESRLLRVEQEMDRIYHAIPEWVHSSNPKQSLSDKVKDGFDKLTTMVKQELSRRSAQEKEHDSFIAHLAEKHRLDLMQEYWEYLSKKTPS